MAKRGNPNWTKGTSGNPSGKRRERADSFYNEYTSHGTSLDSRTYTRHSTRPLNWREAMDLRRGNWLAKRICELKPAECFRKGYTVKLDDKQQAEDLMAVVEALGINKKLVAAGAMENAAGGAALFPVLDGALGKLSTPLDLDRAPRIAAIRAVHMLEPQWLQPESYYDDITHPKFGMPMRYWLRPRASRRGTAGDMIIHESRLAIFPGSRVTQEQIHEILPGWGDSALTPVQTEINDFGLSWGSAAKILHTFSRRVLKLKDFANLASLKGNEEALMQRVASMNLLASTLNTDVIDSEESVEHLVTSIAGLSDMLVQFAQLVSAAADYPMTRLFGMSPAGMNATGEYDQQGWFERIANEQTNKFTEPVEWLLRLIMLSSDGPTGGKEPDVWSAEWLPLQEQNEKEIAETRKLVAETDQIYYGMGLPAVGIFEDRFAGDTFSMNTTFDKAVFEKQQAEEQKMAEEAQAASLEAMKQAGEEKPGESEDEKPEPTE